MIVSTEYSDKALQSIVDRVNRYEALIETAEPIFDLDGKRLEELLREHASNLMTFDSALQEIKALEDLVRARQDAVKSRLWKKFLENYTRALSTRDIETYIAGEPEYTQVLAVILIIAEVKRKLEAIVGSLTSLGWTLNNIVKLRVAQLEHVTL